jgi:hypothetical protein
MSVALSHGVRVCVVALTAMLLLCVRDVATTGGPLAPVSELPLPGGLAAAREAIGDRASPDRALFLVELIERFYNRPEATPDEGTPQVGMLLQHLRQPPPRGVAASPETIPLPLTPDWWIDVVFRGKEHPDTLAAAIVGSHDAAFLYWGLLALDEPTREWLAGRHDIVQALMRGGADRFVVAAPAIRIENGAVRLPGGEPARAAWETLMGASAADPAAFVRAVMADREARRANFYRSLSMLPDEQLSLVLRLRNSDPAARLDALQRLYGVFVRTGSNWSVAARPFFGQPVDPSTLVAKMRAAEDGRLALPGDEAFWSAAFEGRAEPAEQSASNRGRERAPGRRASAREAGPHGNVGSVDLVWLLERVFDGDPARSRVRSDQVLFAARVFGETGLRANSDASVAVAAVGRYPALLRALDRLHIEDPVVYRRAVERASALDDISNRDARIRAIAQFQSALALLVRGVSRGSLSRADAPALVSTLSGIEIDDAGHYAGRLLRWIDRTLHSGPEEGVNQHALAGRPRTTHITEELLRLLAGPPAASPEIVWEDARYRVDPAAGERARLTRLRGEQPTPYLESAWTLLTVADRIEQHPRASTDLTSETEAFESVVRDVGWGDSPPRDSSLPYDEVARALRGRSHRDRGMQPADLASRLRILSDELTARGLMELAYAAALGDPGANPITSADAADRHDFGDDSSAVWRLPQPPAAADGAWRLQGSVLDLDACLAERWLTRVSMKPLPQAPSLQRTDREALVEALVMLEPASLSDESRDTIAAAVRAGRGRIASAKASDLEALADAIPLDPVRRSLLPWVFAHTPDRLAPFFSTGDLAALGLQARDARLDSWGAPAWPVDGCPCLRLPGRLPRSVFTGHPDTGRLASGFPDLSIRLAELLADLHMPASLLPGVLAAATSDLVDRAPGRYAGDMRGLVEYVQGLTADELEQYLALLTTDGPLVLVNETRSAASGSAP